MKTNHLTRSAVNHDGVDPFGSLAYIRRRERLDCPRAISARNALNNPAAVIYPDEDFERMPKVRRRSSLLVRRIPRRAILKAPK